MPKKIGIITDVHGLYEPLEAVLMDMEKRGIDKKYSLGDNLGVGPNPKEVLDLLNKYNVISIAGNSEDYVTLGIQPFDYFDTLKQKSYFWTLSKITNEQISNIKLYPHFIELSIGGQSLALCHFANDVRFDYGINSTWNYQHNYHLGKPAWQQFLYTNSDKQKEEIKRITENNINNSSLAGYQSAKKEPLFSGKTVLNYDAIIQGHVHFKMYEQSDKTKFFTLRALAMGYQQHEKHTASYVMLTETASGYDLKEILVFYDREKMINSIIKSDIPEKEKMLQFTSVSTEERSKIR